jgi:flagellar basal-body rod modification protein FlgD
MIDVVSYLNSSTTGLASTEEDREPTQELGKDAFMQLLITQMTNQNPLDPMENTEFISQLAQFSALELQQNMASAMELLALTQTAATNSQMVNLIGKRVIVPGNQFTLDGKNPVELQFDLEGDAQPAKLVIKDSSGSVVRTLDFTELEEGINKWEFDGKDSNGDLLEAGNYSYQILDYEGDEIEGLTTYANLLVDAVAYEGTSIYLKSQDTTIDLGDVSEVVQNPE